MMGRDGKTKHPPQEPERRRLNIFIGIGFLTALMLFLFWPVVKFLASFVLG